jgi:hypothetical protein
MHLCIKKVYLKKYSLIVLSLFTFIIYGQKTRKYSNSFLDIGVDASALALGGSVVSSTSDISSTYWNPAGLAEVKDKEFALMHSSYFANIANYNYISYAQPLENNKSAVGFSVIRFGVDDILDTTKLIDSEGNINYDRIERFSNTDYAFIFSYASKTPIKNLTLGGNFKVIRRIIGDFANSWGFGFDLGLQYKLSKSWNTGLNFKNISTFNTWTHNEEKIQDILDAEGQEEQNLPEGTEITIPKLQLGISNTHKFNSNYTLQSSLDLMIYLAETNDIVSSKSISLSPAAGFQLDFQDIVFVRTGIGNFQKELNFNLEEEISFQPNIGLGFKYKGISIDYALTDVADQSVALYSNVFSLKVNLHQFNKK